MPVPKTTQPRRLDTEEAPRIVLDILLARHPSLVSMDELAREIAGTAYELSDAQLLAADGMAELSASGLVHQLDCFAFASWTAVRGNQLAI